ncbi:MAG: YidC/Oxa1 family membrane protein insertase [Treponema sp.]|jgi:YidC/Oxa1 family membrane protein insertase|nr:YidC/Oxa1 family membrane protein insertase [Treponema sp.]
MAFLDVLYTLVIWPLRAIIEFLFVFFNRSFYNAGLAVILLSAVVNTALLPIYTVADRWQGDERLRQNRMKKKLAGIRAVFSGDERQFIINTYYRQMGYSPLSALKSSVGLLLQIPFFIAAYQFLSHTSGLGGESFWFLKDLGAADAMFSFRGFTVNIMPMVMTVINLFSAAVYTRGFSRREKVQLFGMALLFLALLYNSPSGLVLYWTCNNLYSLGKNIAVHRLKRPARTLQILSSLLGFLLMAGALSGAFDVDRYTWVFVLMGLAVILAPFALKALTALAEKAGIPQEDWRRLYFSSAAILVVLPGLLIPAQVIGGSVSDFARPWGFIGRTFLQSLSMLGLVPLLIWAFAGPPIKKILAPAFASLSLLGMVCLFALSASYGLMTNSFKIEDTQLIINAFPFWVNPLAVLGALLLPAVFAVIKKIRLFASIYNAVLAALLILSLVNLYSVHRGIGELAAIEKQNAPAALGEGQDAVFPFTRRGNNVFIMFLDRAMGAAMYTALEEMPRLKDQFDGFTWYPNTLSYGHCTVTGLPAMLGGYDYRVEKIDERKDELLRDKINEALTMMPKLFGERGYRVTVTDPTMANMQLVPDNSIFRGLRNVRSFNLDGRMDKRFLGEFPQEEERLIDSFDFDILFRYGLFRIALPVLRYGIQYKGTWWRDGASNAYGRGLTEFSTLYYLGDFCAADEGPDTLNIFMNETTHEPGAYTKNLRPEPGIIKFSGEEIDAFGSEDNAVYMYAFLSAMNAVGRFTERLKDLGVYDNSRIIICSDHGNSFDTDLFGGSGMESYNPLFMVKERERRGALEVSGDFMTNADTVVKAAADLDNPVNPYSGTPLDGREKTMPQTVGRAVSFQPRRHGPFLYNLSGRRVLTAPDIFAPPSWEPWEAAGK